MSVWIKIPMPENCAECPCLRHDSIDGVNAYQCNITFGIRKNIDRKPKWCPLVDLGKHGRLIDEKEVRTVMNWLLTQPQRPTWNDTYHAIQEMNAAVEAEGEG